MAMMKSGAGMQLNMPPVRTGMMAPAKGKAPIPTQAPMPVTAAPGVRPGAPGKATAASPDEQAAYKQFVTNGMRLMYAKKALPAIMKSLDGDGDPMTGILATLVMIVTKVANSARQAGKMISPNVVLHGAGELLEQLADLSAQSGGHKYSDAELQKAANLLVTGTMQQKSGAAGGPPAPGAQPPAQTPAPPPAQPVGGPPGLMG